MREELSPELTDNKKIKKENEQAPKTLTLLERRKKEKEALQKKGEEASNVDQL